MAWRYADFVAGLAGLTVAGVKRAYPAPPAQLNRADLPALYPRFPTAARQVGVLSGGMEIARATCELVVVVEPVGQAGNVTNFAACLALVDALATALAGAVDSVGVDGYDLRVDVEHHGDTAYWAVMATVEGSGA